VADDVAGPITAGRGADRAGADSTRGSRCCRRNRAPGYRTPVLAVAQQL